MEDKTEMGEEKGSSSLFSSYPLMTAMLMETLEYKPHEGKDLTLLIVVSPESASHQVEQWSTMKAG